MGLLGTSVGLGVKAAMPRVRLVGYAHRLSTRRKVRRLGVIGELPDDIGRAVENADMVILAAPIRTFEQILGRIAASLKPGCIVTDVGSTKVLPHRWAARLLPRNVHFVGSHPIAGSEQRGAEAAQEDLLDGAYCIVTVTGRTNSSAAARIKNFWRKLGCTVRVMSPAKHDRLLANISHLPHCVAAALVNANTDDDLALAGTGFIDTTRIASSPANIWLDIFLTNPAKLSGAINRSITELLKFRKAIDAGDEKKLRYLLRRAQKKRDAIAAARKQGKGNE